MSLELEQLKDRYRLIKQSLKDQNANSDELLQRFLMSQRGEMDFEVFEQIAH